MPIYEYQCEECGEKTEAIQKLSDPPLTTCESCGGTLVKLISSPAFQFKGTGWYVTDYARAGRSEGGEKRGEKGDGASESSSKSDAKPAETKSAGSDG